MKMLLTALVLAIIPLVMSGCGSGDFSSGGTTINGVAAKGPITGGKVAIFSVTTSAHIGKQLATGTTTSGGAFSANLGAYTGAIFATMSGSSASYTDESSNTTKTLGTAKLHAAAVVTAPGPFNLAITPLTELAYQKAASLKSADITAANTLISNLFLQGTSIISTLPVNIMGTVLTVTDPEKINYSLTLAAFSQLIASSDIATGIADLSDSIAADGTFTPPADWTAALASLSSNTNIPATITSVPVSIAFTPTTYSAIINQPVTLTVSVTKFDGSALAGAAVSFKTSNGTLSVPAVTDANGATTVTLTPSVIGTVTVNATATLNGVTAATNTAATVSVVHDPNDPGSVTLTSSSSSVQIGQTVTLTANVGVVGGGPNNVTPGNPPPTGTAVTFKITSGTGTLGTATTTDSNGNATVSLTSTTANTVTVTASAGTSPVVTSSPVTVTFTPDPLAPATVSVVASPTSIAADGASTSTITATVTNYAGTPLSGVPVTFAKTTGTLSATSGTTNSSGIATVTLTSTTTAGSATVTASATADSVTKTGSTTVTFAAVASGTVTVIVGTSGTLSSGITIGAIQANLTYSTNKGLTPTSAVASGVGAGSILTPNLTGTAGVVTLGLITSTGISTGQFATVTFSYTGATPTASDFAIASGATVTDETGTTTLSGISVVVKSVTVN